MLCLINCLKYPTARLILLFNRHQSLIFSPLYSRSKTRSAAQLVHEPHHQLRKLNHMVKVHCGQRIARRVNQLARLLKGSLDDERRRVAGLGSGCVVGAGVAALCLDVRDRAVLHINNISHRLWEIIEKEKNSQQ